MKKEYYYLTPSSTFSGLTALASKLVEEAKEKYDGAVMSRQALEQAVGALRISAGELKLQHPRWGMPRVDLFFNEHTGNASLYINDWCLLCRRVSKFID